MSIKELKQSKGTNNSGLIFIGIGAVVLILQNVNLPDFTGLLILPTLAAIFMLAGIINRDAGYMVPGGILAGVGLGTILASGEASLGLSQSIDDGALFMFSFALGWLSITLMSALFTDETARWPLIPATIMALIGATVLNESLFAPIWEILNKGWPVGMIALGIWSLMQAMQNE